MTRCFFLVHKFSSTNELGMWMLGSLAVDAVTDFCIWFDISLVSYLRLHEQSLGLVAYALLKS